MRHADRFYYRSCFLDGLHGEPFHQPFTDWHNMHKAGIALAEYLSGDQARNREGLSRGWRREMAR